MVNREEMRVVCATVPPPPENKYNICAAAFASKADGDSCGVALREMKSICKHRWMYKLAHITASRTSNPNTIALPFSYLRDKSTAECENGNAPRSLKLFCLIPFNFYLRRIQAKNRLDDKSFCSEASASLA